MKHKFTALAALLAVSLALSAAGRPPTDLTWLGKPDLVASGIELYRSSDPSLLSPQGVVTVQLLRLDPKRVHLDLALAQDTVLGLETVQSMASRGMALAAVNAGFFLPTGEPAGLFKIDGEFVSDVASHRGAVAIAREGLRRSTHLTFDQVRAHVELDVGSGGSRSTLRADGVDTVRAPGALVLFTPRFWTDTRTPCDGGTEIVIDGTPWRVSDRREGLCGAAIPRGGAVLAAGPAAKAGAIDALLPGARLRARAVYEPLNGTDAEDWDEATDIVGGVGLLMVDGRMLNDWSAEKPSAAFATTRHPRTMIGTAGDGRTWLITVDGRNPSLSLGMNFAELQGLARRVGLVNALNLDGGGSTTMVVKGAIVNHPSDPTGPRRVSDAIVVR